jgi:hypothetical protein
VEFLCYINRVDRVVRWYRSARRHKIGKVHAMHVISTIEPIHVPRFRVGVSRRPAGLDRGGRSWHRA